MSIVEDFEKSKKNWKQNVELWSNVQEWQREDDKLFKVMSHVGKRKPISSLKRTPKQEGHVFSDCVLISNGSTVGEKAGK